MGDQLSPEVLAIHQWIRDDAPVTIQMTITPTLISALAERLKAARDDGSRPEIGKAAGGIDQAVAILRLALAQDDLGTVKALIKAALDFATNDEEALAMGREFQDGE